MAETQAGPEVNTFCWNELGTRDLSTARSLLSNLFGWKADERDMGPDGKYTVFNLGDKMVAGLYELKGPRFANTPTHWMSYVAVTNADVTAKSAERLGMKITTPVTPIPNVGRFAVFEHPSIGMIAILEPQRS